MKNNNFYITTPIYYVNDRPHIGHAYTSVACDVMARFMRHSGKKVMFLTGTDEHGQKVEKSAAAAGIDPKSFVDGVSAHFRELTGLMNISNDDFIRTTEARHIAAAQALWQQMEKNGDIYLGSYSGWYSVRDEAYYAESELVEGKAPTGAEVEWVEEPSYFFRLSAYGDKLLAYYDAHPEMIAPPSRRNEIISFVKGGLKDLSISRTTFTWGIPVPGNEKHVMYVWLDALTNYLSALGYPQSDSQKYTDFWPASMHMVGKDIIRFHAVYWPAFLMSANLPLPERVFAHGWWTVEGEKMSKSIGNVVAPAELVEKYGLDQTRYFLMREVPFGNDGNFSHERMVTVINSELANNIGNLLQRTLSFIQKNANCRVPQPHSDIFDAPVNIDTQKLGNYFLQCQFNLAIEEITSYFRALNNYIDVKAPWKLAKEDASQNEMQDCLYNIIEASRKLAIYLQPFMPHASAKILDMLSAPEGERDFAHATPEFALKVGAELPAPQAVFPRIMDK